jgi:hypothetical protein
MVGSTPADGRNIEGKVLALAGPCQKWDDLTAFESETRDNNVD